MSQKPLEKLAEFVIITFEKMPPGVVFRAHKEFWRKSLTSNHLAMNDETFKYRQFNNIELVAARLDRLTYKHIRDHHGKISASQKA